MVPEQIREDYWRTIRRTRKSGRIAQTVIARIEREWEKFDDDVAAEALRVHMDTHPDYKENYTLGIMRNLQRQKDAHRPFKRAGKTRFNNFSTQREYDFDDLEQRLLDAQKKGG